jgi:Family of unknown function (DUF6502)
MSDDARSHLIHAFRKVLRPLVKILIRAGIRQDEFADVIKGVYVESAIRDGIGREGPLTRARISLTTGVPRRDVDRYIDNEHLLFPPPATHTNILTEVLHLWHTDPIYLGPYGIPLEIDFDETLGRNFVELVKRVSPSADPIGAFEELLKSGAVVRSGERFIKFVSRYYVVSDLLSPQALENFGAAMGHLAQTLENNLGMQGNRKLLQRQVVADRGLPQSQMEEFESYVKVRVQQMLEDVDDWLGKRIAPTAEFDDPMLGTGVAVFHYVDVEDKTVPALSSVVAD